MADFGKGKKIGERNKRKLQILGEKNWKWLHSQADLIGKETDRKFMGKLDLLFFFYF